MSTIKEILVKSFSENEEDLKELDDLFNRMTGSYGAESIFICQDDDSVIYVYSGGDLQYGGDAWGWQNGTGTVRTVLNSDGDYLKVPLASDFETSKVNVQELLALVRVVKAGGVIPPALFSTDMIDPPKIVSQGSSITPVQPTVVGVESMRDRIIEIDSLLDSLKEEREDLIDKITEKGFTLILESTPRVIEVGTLVELVSVDNSNTAMQVGQRGRVTAINNFNHGGGETSGLDIDDKWYVSIKDVKFISKK